MNTSVVMSQAQPIWRRYSFWLGGYIVALALNNAIFYGWHQISFNLVNGGLMLAALLIAKHPSRRFLIAFIVALFAIDLADKLLVAPELWYEAFWRSLTLTGQAVLAMFLVNKYLGAKAKLDSQSDMTRFIGLAVILPVTASTMLLELILQLQADLSSQIEPTNHHLLWCFLSRMTSVLLITPTLVILIEHLQRPLWARRPFLDQRLFVAALSSLPVVAFLIALDNPEGESLATYSYFLIPIYVLLAINFSLAKSLVLSFLMALISFNVDALTAGTGRTAQESFIALAEFLVFNHLVVWLLGTLQKERREAYKQEKHHRMLYEITSNINRLFAQHVDQAGTLFTKMCEILIDKGPFSQACVTVIDQQLLAGGYLSVCSTAQRSDFVSLDSAKQRSPLLEGVIESARPIYLNNAAEYDATLSASPPATRHKFPSLAAIPVILREKVVAVISLYADEDRLFSTSVISMLNRVNQDLSFTLEIQQQRQRLKQVAEVFQHSHEAILITHPDGTIVDVNPSFTRMTGYSAAEVKGKNPRLLKSGIQPPDFYAQMYETLSKERFWTGEFWNVKKSGELFPQRGTISAVYADNGELLHYISIMEDISEHLQAEEKIERLANYDALTGLPNHILLQQKFSDDFASMIQQQKQIALLFIDLDNFKHINDALGHEIGNLVLKEVSDRLHRALREKDVLSRFSSDEFIMLATGNFTDATKIANRLIKRMRNPLKVRGQVLHLSCSIGIALSPEHGTSLDELIRAADTAMHQAKLKGKGQFAVFARCLQEQIITQLALQNELEVALSRGQLELYYQPKYTCVKDHYFLSGFEALVRWNHPTKGMIPPGEFIPAAEESGQIANLDRFVLHQALQQIKTWQTEVEGFSQTVAVNVSASLFSRSDFVAELRDLIANSGITPHLLELEITEHIAMFDQEHTLTSLTELKKLGVRLAIDDFGTGYSSLSYLSLFPIDTLKIDLGFVRDVHLNKKRQGIVRAIIAMAETLNLETIAEGVENQAELEFLRRAGCTHFQGYFFSKPQTLASADKVARSSTTGETPKLSPW